jgi:hypothetical protein
MTVRELIAQMLGRDVETNALPLSWDKDRLDAQVYVDRFDDELLESSPNIGYVTTRKLKRRKNPVVVIGVDVRG